MVQYVYHRSNLRGTAECAVFVNGRCDLTICNEQVTKNTKPFNQKYFSFFSPCPDTYIQSINQAENAFTYNEM